MSTGRPRENQASRDRKGRLPGGLETLRKGADFAGRGVLAVVARSCHGD